MRKRLRTAIPKRSSELTEAQTRFSFGNPEINLEPSDRSVVSAVTHPEVNTALTHNGNNTSIKNGFSGWNAMDAAQENMRSQKTPATARLSVPTINPWKAVCLRVCVLAATLLMSHTG